MIKQIDRGSNAEETMRAFLFDATLESIVYGFVYTA